MRTDYDGYLIVLHVDPEGRLRVLFPVDPDKDNFVRSGKKYEVRDRGDREAFEVDATGRGSVYAAVSRDPFRFDGLTYLITGTTGQWPRPGCGKIPSRSSTSCFSAWRRAATTMTCSATRSSAGRPTFRPRRYYGSLYDDDWCSYSCGRPYFGYSPFRLSIGFFYGRPYRNYYYDPYYYAYDPYYNPFFYDPYYYAPAYYPRYVYPRRYYGYGSPYYHDRYRTYNRPYTPYRFRGSDGFSAGYRDRRYDLRRAVNTVYTPPLSRIREPAAQPVVRRVTDDGADLPNGLAPRRAVGHETRVQSRPIEGRRARQPEPRREAMSGGRATDNRPVIRREEPRVERTRDAARPVERSREEPRRVERSPAPQARPERREVQRSSPPPQARSSGRAESRGGGGGGGREGGSRPSNSGGTRRR